MDDKSTIRFSADTKNKIQTLIELDSDNFLELIAAAKLNKRTDFIGMSFDDMKLDGLELKGFDFSYADFRGCSLQKTIFVECELKGAAFKFPPEVHDRWQRKPDIFLGEIDTTVLELMRIASESPRKEDRKTALDKLVQIRNTDSVTAFLQNAALKDKAKSLRHWLKAKLTSGFRKKEELKPILERSLFEGGRDLNEDITLYVKLLEGSNEVLETLLQVCAVNSLAIERAGEEIGENESFKRVLLRNLSFSADRQIWIRSATALRNLKVGQKEKETAFNFRLLRVEDRYDVSQLAKTAAYNNVKNKGLFQLSERGYRDTLDAWRADDFLLYCYFYESTQYQKDVLFYSFRETESTQRDVSSSTAFAAYCFLNEPELYHFVESENGYFYVDPLTLIGSKEDIYREDRFSTATQNRLKELAQLGYEQAREIKIEDLVRKPAAEGA